MALQVFISERLRVGGEATITHSDMFDIAMFNVKRSENIKCTRCSRGVSRVNWKCPNIRKTELPIAALPV
jgi:lipopolysaccharide biosynthesis regulator YciM